MKKNMTLLSARKMQVAEENVSLDNILKLQKLVDSLTAQLQNSFENETNEFAEFYDLEDQNGNYVEHIAFSEVSKYFVKSNFLGETYRYMGEGLVAVNIDSIILSAEEALETMREKYYNSVKK